MADSLTRNFLARVEISSSSSRTTGSLVGSVGGLLGFVEGASGAAPAD
jgi:hypothetical protein